MDAQELIAWFDEIEEAAKKIPIEKEKRAGGYFYEIPETVAWVVDASSAISEVFNKNHPARASWANATQLKADEEHWKYAQKSYFSILTSLFKTAANQVRSGRVQSLADTLRANSESDLLDQATDLNNKGHQAAATVIAGGTLEMHLRHLCEKHNITWTGSGSISAYEVAIAKERKNGTVVVFEKSVGKQVTAWGGRRNDAAHSPGTYTATKEVVQLMIDGVRQFILNHP